jgi:hypothetical protein
MTQLLHTETAREKHACHTLLSSGRGMDVIVVFNTIAQVPINELDYLLTLNIKYLFQVIIASNRTFQRRTRRKTGLIVKPNRSERSLSCFRFFQRLTNAH